MRKMLGYIPLDPSEDHFVIAKETDVIKIEDQWFKLCEVWIPGVSMPFGEVEKQALIYGEWKVQPKEEKFKKEFEPLERQRAKGMFRVCKNCGKMQDAHVLFKICP
jgi:hypothetical protein